MHNTPIYFWITAFHSYFLYKLQFATFRLKFFCIGFLSYAFCIMNRIILIRYECYPLHFSSEFKSHTTLIFRFIFYDIAFSSCFVLYQNKLDAWSYSFLFIMKVWKSIQYQYTWVVYWVETNWNWYKICKNKTFQYLNSFKYIWGVRSMSFKAIEI